MNHIGFIAEVKGGHWTAFFNDIFSLFFSMTPTLFLRIGGFLSLGIGLWGMISPEGAGEELYFDLTENIVHTAFGVLLLATGWLDALASLRRHVTWFTGTISFAIGIAGLFVASDPSPNFLSITNLEHPIDNMLHLVFGAWALFCAWGKEKGVGKRS